MSRSFLSKPREWVELHGDVLFRFAFLRVRDREVAEDIVQETFLAALRAKDTFAGESTERTWLTGILRRKVVDHFRKMRSTRSLDDLSPAEEFAAIFFDESGHWRSNVPAWPDNPHDALVDRDFWRVFDDCMSKLPASIASAFCLRELEQIDPQETCKILGITTTNLWARIYRSRMRLRECLEKNWFQLPPQSQESK